MTPDALDEIRAYVARGDAVPAHLVAQLLAFNRRAPLPKRAAPELVTFVERLIDNYYVGASALARHRRREGGS